MLIIISLVKWLYAAVPHNAAPLPYPRSSPPAKSEKRTSRISTWYYRKISFIIRLNFQHSRDYVAPTIGEMVIAAGVIY